VETPDTTLGDWRRAVGGIEDKILKTINYL